MKPGSGLTDLSTEKEARGFSVHRLPLTTGAQAEADELQRRLLTEQARQDATSAELESLRKTLAAAEVKVSATRDDIAVRLQVSTHSSSLYVCIEPL